jgi:hypothetical protein
MNQSGRAMYLEFVAGYFFLLQNTSEYANSWRFCVDHHDTFDSTLDGYLDNFFINCWCVVTFISKLVHLSDWMPLRSVTSECFGSTPFSEDSDQTQLYVLLSLYLGVPSSWPYMDVLTTGGAGCHPYSDGNFMYNFDIPTPLFIGDDFIVRFCLDCRCTLPGSV